MGFIGFWQRQRTNRLLADQLSVARTGQTGQEQRAARAREDDARVLTRALVRHGTSPGLAAWYARLDPEQRRAWRESNPGVIK
jgi:hypothetical protein